MSADRQQRDDIRVSPSIAFIDRFLRKRAPSEMVGLLLVQIDSYNRISTTFGVKESRDCCAAYAGTLRALLPNGSPVIRLSDRRFALLVETESESGLADLAEIIAEAHQPEMHVGDDYFSVDVSVGVAVCPLHADDGASLYRRADLALKTAQDKDESFAIYRPNATRQQATIWKLESDLKRAIAEGELDVFYQPKIDLETSSVCGVEALVRWCTQDGRALSPGGFVPIAERTGNITALTWSVFESVVECVHSWGALEPPFGLAINVSPQVIDRTEFYPRLLDVSKELASANVSLAIELTEDSLLKGDSRSLKNLHKIRDLGVDLAIDDFGKGYSSLTYLKQVPATEIKIDKKFIEMIGVDETDQQIVGAIINLAHALGMKVVAEGVDSQESLLKVAELNCDVAQGFLIARPMHGEHFLDWLANFSPDTLVAGGGLILRGPLTLEG